MFLYVTKFKFALQCLVKFLHMAAVPEKRNLSNRESPEEFHEEAALAP